MSVRLGFRERQAAKGLELACVYLITPQPQFRPRGLVPTRINVATDLTKRFHDFKAAHWAVLENPFVAWFEGKPLAHRVALLAESYIKGSRAVALNGGWFSIDPAIAEALVKKAANVTGTPWFGEAERRARLKAEVENRLDKAGAALLGS